MTCINCGSEHVTLSMERVGDKTRTRNAGCLWALGRFFLILCTCGLWLLVGKRRATSNTTAITKRAALCQDCGHHWFIDK
jgi:hypothetical protein